MSNKLTNLLSNPIYFRCGFFISLILSFLHIGQEHSYVLYIIATIFLGIGFYNLSFLFLFIAVTMIVIILLLHSFEALNLPNFLFMELTYLLILSLSVGLMKHAQKIKKAQLELILALSKALDSRDAKTSNHSYNAAKYAARIAEKMNLPKDVVEIVRKGGLLHDIGKIGIPENILNKPSSLTNEEYNTIKEHPVIGHEMIKHVVDFNHQNGILDIVLYHHERYDGKGYPKGLKENEIPLVARIMAIADSFEAMTSSRVYRNEIDIESALLEIQRNKGKQFDPEITDVFLSLFDGKSRGEEYE